MSIEDESAKVRKETQDILKETRRRSLTIPIVETVSKATSMT